jgi:hypothetical protein
MRPLGGIGRSLWDRAVDAPALQDGPAWKGAGLGSYRGEISESLNKVPQRPYAAAAGNEEGCGLIAYGQISSQLTVRGSAAFRAARRSPPCGRLLAVFTEGADSSLPDWGNASETCEIGGLG